MTLLCMIRLGPVAAACFLLIGGDVASPAQGPDPLSAREPTTGEGLKLAFAEEFDGQALDERRWRTAFKQGAVSDRSLYANRELQLYFDQKYLGLGVQPFKVRGGALTINAAPMSPTVHKAVLAEIAKQPKDIRCGALRRVRFTSGIITTRSTFSQLYGYFEARLRADAGNGLWPAFWLLPEDGSWPPEIDVLEALGHDPRIAAQSVHTKQTGKHVGVTRKAAIDSIDQFHTYGVLWDPKYITFYIDGVKTSSIETPRDMNKPMYMVLDLAVIQFPRGGNGYTLPPRATMDVDYVRAWSFGPVVCGEGRVACVGQKPPASKWSTFVNWFDRWLGAPGADRATPAVPARVASDGSEGFAACDGAS